MTKRIYISEAEHVALMKATTDAGQAIACAFGGGRVWLSQDAEGGIVSRWAVPIIAKMRGITQESGAGI